MRFITKTKKFCQLFNKLFLQCIAFNTHKTQLGNQTWPRAKGRLLNTKNSKRKL